MAPTLQHRQAALIAGISSTSTPNFCAAAAPARWKVSYAVVSVMLVQNIRQANARGARSNKKIGLLNFAIGEIRKTEIPLERKVPPALRADRIMCSKHCTTPKKASGTLLAPLKTQT